MISPKNSIALFLILCLLVPTPALPMTPTLGSGSSKNYSTLKSAISSAAGLAIGSCIGLGIGGPAVYLLLGKYRSRSLPDAPDQIKNFVHQEAKAMSLKNAKNIMVKISSNEIASANRLPDEIAINPERIGLEMHRENETITLEEILKNPAKYGPDGTKIKNIWRYIIQHECSHIKNNDSHKRVFLESASMFCLAGLITTLPIEKSPRLSIACCAASLAAIVGGNIAYARSQEQRADDGVQNDADVLQGGIHFFRESHQQTKKSYTYLNMRNSLPYSLCSDDIADSLIAFRKDPDTHTGLIELKNLKNVLQS